MSSLSSSASSGSPRPTNTVPGFRPHATSDHLRISEAGPALDQRLERRRSTLSGPDRKRRLVSPDVVYGSRPERPLLETGLNGRAETDSRPIPKMSSRTPSNTALPGSSYDTAIDLSSSPPEPPPRRTADARRSSSGGGNQYVDYIPPRWQPDSEVTECPICGITFSFWYRKHHCRKCGRVVCASCSPHRITIPRQYIVHPPASNRSSASALAQRATQVINLEPDNSTQSPMALNPALGGGEEVRLCNPCVPDPNPEPPVGYPPARAPGQLGSGAGWTREPCVVQQATSRHRSYHSLPSASRQPSYTAIPDSFPVRPGRRIVGSSDFPAVVGFGGAYATPFQERPGYGSMPSSRYAPASPSSSRQSVYYPYAAGPSSSPPGVPGPSVARPRVSRVSHSRPSQQIDERDVCPICDNRLPPIGAGGDEAARESHIRDCIESHGRPQVPSGSPVSQSPLPVRMIAFTATEKDCIGQDGTEQECTICMEEYEVGQSLVRLECLCKFHKRCIVEWFRRKKECPVHKAS